MISKNWSTEYLTAKEILFKNTCIDCWHDANCLNERQPNWKTVRKVITPMWDSYVKWSIQECEIKIAKLLKSE